jgi:hypothetical protein
MSVILTPIQGVDFARMFTDRDYAGSAPPGGFTSDADLIEVTAWPATGGPATALPIGATGAWIDSAAGTWIFTLAGADSARVLPGWYRFLATVRRGDGQVAELLSGDILLSASSTMPGIPAPSPVLGLPDAATLGHAAPVWCSDEHVAIRCGPDFHSLLPVSQILAAGSDGAFAALDPWTLTSGSSDFANQIPACFPSSLLNPSGWGLAAATIEYGRVGFVVRLNKPSSLVGGAGQSLAVAAVSSSSLTLRRLGLGANVGMAPAPSTGCIGVDFEVRTLYPQIEAISYRINQRFNIDPYRPDRMPGNLEDIRPLRDLAVATVLYERYSDESRRPNAEYKAKADAYMREILELEDRLRLRWTTGPVESGDGSVFGARYYA